jgi:hypothetical protein
MAQQRKDYSSGVLRRHQTKCFFRRKKNHEAKRTSDHSEVIEYARLTGSLNP